MPIDFIAIDTAKKYGRKAERYVELLREVRDLGEHVVGVLNRSAADPDYTAVATRFGVSLADAQPLYNLLVAAHARVDHAAVVALIDRVG